MGTRTGRETANLHSLDPRAAARGSAAVAGAGADRGRAHRGAGAGEPWPLLVGAQYTFVDQKQSALTSPYEGRLSLRPDGDQQASHTIGFYGGWAPLSWLQLYLDTEKFMGAAVSNATGVGNLTNGDVIHAGSGGLKKEFYIARSYVRLMLPLSAQLTRVERAQDQIPGTEAATRIELKAGRLSVSDDIDKNRYANATRTQFMNASLWQNTAWDFAANTRGFSNGVVLGYISPTWALRYAIFQMPTHANGQELETLKRARGENLELTLSPAQVATVLRLLVFRNTARMGDYREAIAAAAGTGSPPVVSSTGEDGRHKYGFGVNAEQPLADDGGHGAFPAPWLERCGDRGLRLHRGRPACQLWWPALRGALAAQRRSTRHRRLGERPVGSAPGLSRRRRQRLYPRRRRTQLRATSRSSRSTTGRSGHGASSPRRCACS